MSPFSFPCDEGRKRTSLRTGRRELRWCYKRRQSSFQLSVQLLRFCRTTLCDWLRILAPLLQLIKSKAKTNRDLLACVFPRLAPATCICYKFWLLSVLINKTGPLFVGLRWYKHILCLVKVKLKYVTLSAHVLHIQLLYGTTEGSLTSGATSINYSFRRRLTPALIRLRPKKESIKCLRLQRPSSSLSYVVIKSISFPSVTHRGLVKAAKSFISGYDTMRINRWVPGYRHVGGGHGNETDMSRGAWSLIQQNWTN